MTEQHAKFQVGAIIHHKMFGYLGVIYDVDPTFAGSEEWYDQMARSQPPKNKPWYHVLVDRAEHTTYVAEQNLEPASSPQAIKHALTEHFFNNFDGQKYTRRGHVN